MNSNGVAPHFGRADDEDVIRESRFLIDEGFELLADFRSIDDLAIRRSIRTLVSAIARKRESTVIAFPIDGDRND